MGDFQFSTGAQDPNWDSNDPLRNWYLGHFQAYVLVGLKCFES